MGKSEKSVKEFALIGFILLAVLFGMQIMVFIFGGLSSADILADETITTINETEAWLNQTAYTVAQASESDFTGGLVITALWNATSNGLGNYNHSIPLANATATASSGTFISADFFFNSTNISVSYTTSHKTEAEVTSEGILNNSLNAISNYSTQAGTQFTTLGIAITLILLVAVFLFFWQAFMGKGKGGEGPASFS